MRDEELQDLRESLRRIETALVGDPAMGNRGVVARLGDVEGRLGTVETETRVTTIWRENVKARLALAATVVSGLVAAVVEIAKSYFSAKH